jgi:hypothetical protein
MAGDGLMVDQGLLISLDISFLITMLAHQLMGLLAHIAKLWIYSYLLTM